jgi:hypothetical protein
MKRVLLFAALIAWSGMASAVVYKWTDAQGKTLYGDRPPDGVHAEVVELLGTHAPSSPRPADNSRAAPSPTQGAPAPQKTAASGDDAAKKNSDTGAEQVKQCAEAQDRFKKLTEGRHLYKEGANGERQYMTSQEIDSERADAKREIDAVCSGQS